MAKTFTTEDGAFVRICYVSDFKHVPEPKTKPRPKKESSKETIKLKGNMENGRILP